MTSPPSLMDRLCSPYIHEVDQALVESTNSKDKIIQLHTNQMHVDASYPKWACKIDAAPEPSTIACYVYFQEPYDFWGITDKNGNHLLIGKPINNTTPNLWWSQLKESLGVHGLLVPQLFGDLLIMRWNRPLVCTLAKLEKELKNWLISNFTHNTKYALQI